MYEFVDTIPMILLGPIYEKNWGLLVGFCNCFLRLGSVFNFILSPFIYNLYRNPTDGLKAAFWTSTSIISMGVICALFSVYFQIILVRSSENVSTERSVLAKPLQPASPVYTNQSILSKISNRILAIIPFHLFTSQYYYFLLGGAMLYGAMVPFWFVGSKFLQDGFGLSVTVADLLLLLPEGMITVISIPLGYYLDYLKLSMPTQLRILALSVSMLTLSYSVLVYESNYKSTNHAISTEAIAIFMMIVLGCGYGISNCLLYTCALIVICGGSSSNENSKILLGPGSGLLACSMNILPAVIPLIGGNIIQANHGNSGKYILLLGVISIVSSGLFIIASLHQPSSNGNDITSPNSKGKELAVSISIPPPRNPLHALRNDNPHGEYSSLKLQEEEEDGDVFVL